jgi:hypothetical protein
MEYKGEEKENQKMKILLFKKAIEKIRIRCYHLAISIGRTYKILVGFIKMTGRIYKNYGWKCLLITLLINLTTTL